MRISEACALQWGDLDLEVGSVALDDNNTLDARSWALDAAVVRTLRALHNARQPRSDDLVFVESNGGPYELSKVADRLRPHLWTAGVQRAELHEDGTNRRKIRVHDLRGTFFTISLANGKSETWVADRTGHQSSAMVNRYRRQARSAKELGLGSLRPLDQVLSDPDYPSIAHLGTLCEEPQGEKTKQIQILRPLGGMADAEDLKASVPRKSR